jgi:hypothetical protein
LVSEAHRAKARVYRIAVEGTLDEDWSDWLGGLTITLQPDGRTWLTGPVADQAALHGLMDRIRDAGLTLLSVESWQAGRDQTSQQRSTNERGKDSL